MVNQLKAKGQVAKLVVTDAEGNANTQISQIQSMIDANVDAIVVIAGSSTALNRVIEQACEKGIAVANVDSLVTTDQLTVKINTDSHKWGEQAADFLVKQIGGKGKIIVMNGPAGISVSEDRRAGATPVLKAHPDVKILTETNTAYNAAPAQEAMTSLLFPYPQIDGILSLGGALSAGAILAMDRQGRDIPPMTGENYREFLELWKEKELKAWATMQPNWLGGLRRLRRGPGARRQGRAGLRRGPAADHHQRQPRPVPRPRQGLPGGRLHLLALQASRCSNQLGHRRREEVSACVRRPSWRRRLSASASSTTRSCGGSRSRSARAGSTRCSARTGPASRR